MSVPIEPILIFLLVLVRMLTFFSFLPVFSEMYLPVRARVVTASVVAFLFFPMVHVDAGVFPQTLSQLVALMIPEALLGFSFAMVGRVLFATIQLAGNLIGDNMGFNMSQVMAPGLGGQLPLLAQTVYVFALLVFFTVNAHHPFFAAMAKSFEVAPPGFVATVGDLTMFFRERTSQMFLVAVQLSMPVLTVLLVVTLGIGLLYRAVPQINVFMESFPIRILLGFFLLTGMGGYLLHYFAGMCERVERDLLIVLDLITP